MSDPTENRDAAGRWAPGQSGNPAGRAPGIGKIRRLRELLYSRVDDLQAVIDRLIQDARGGDTNAARLLLERVIPPIKSESAGVVLEGLAGRSSLTAKTDVVLRAVEMGQLAPDLGVALLSGLARAAHIVEIDELEKRLRALELKELV